MLETKRPGLTITEEPGGLVHKQLVDYDETVLLDETVLPHDDLIRFMDRPLKEYRQKLSELKEHPLFEESIDVSMTDHHNFVHLCFEVARSFRVDFPEAYFILRINLEDALTEIDDGSASFLLYSGMKALNIVQHLYDTRIKMRNIMEVCFGTTDGLSQHERWERVATIYPRLYHHAFASRWKPEGEGWVQEYEMRSLLELYVFELCAALRSNKRIARCQHCWRYFVPKTNKKTDYCDRIIKDGRTCKQLGPNLKRKDGPAEDRYLLAVKILRARFYEQMDKEYTNTMQGFRYYDWSEEVSAARAAYLKGEIDGEELLRRINPENEELDLEMAAQKPKDDILFYPWEKLVEKDMGFDPNRHYETKMILDLREETPEWKILTPQDQIQNAKHGETSLREKYRKQKE